jgi:Glycosyl hydrolase family 63 C-terminal domain
MSTAEEQRLANSYARTENWHRWGPYLSERQWGTVREDYSDDGEAWNYFTHEQARSRAYLWGEDGLLGITDRECRLCFALALWNEKDPILKERLFGLTGPEGNHGEDVKEVYFYADSTPTHSYMKGVYKYPQAEYPYGKLVDGNRRRNRSELEYELEDTGIFAENRYFDITAEYAKASPDDILIRITITNHGPEAAPLRLLPTLWFRNTWRGKQAHEEATRKPVLWPEQPGVLLADHETLGQFQLHYQQEACCAAELLLTENETNQQLLFRTENSSPATKDAFHHYLVHGDSRYLSPVRRGTKSAIHYRLRLQPGETQVVKLRLVANSQASTASLGNEFDAVFKQRIAEADLFYDTKLPAGAPAAEKAVCRQAYAGLLWSKQFYYYAVREWQEGDNDAKSSAQRKAGRNKDWKHLFNRDIVSMPDKWEYPWYAAWDLAFHMLPMATIDPEFAKSQLLLMLREWYMHPNGQIPAYEFNFSDVNPPVHAWACWRIYKITAPKGQRDVSFLQRAFHKLLINFTWWINRKDVNGNNLFAGGFLGLDNIGVFDRSKPLPTGGYLEQADGTAWMGFYCATMLSIALELAQHDAAYEDIASKFFEHFVAIADAMNTMGGTGLWDEQDGFFYDQLHTASDSHRLRIRSMVGIIPLFAAEVLDDNLMDRLPGFHKRMEWFLNHRHDLASQISYMAHEREDGELHTKRLLAIPTKERLERVLKYVLDEAEFLSPFGVRALSKHHEAEPYTFRCGGEEHRVAYVPGESDSWMFGGNSNWRGPVWFPVNYLLIEALERYDWFYGDDFQIECPTGSGNMVTLKGAAEEICRRMCQLFLPGETGQRPCHGGNEMLAKRPDWQNYVLFHEYFHGDTGRGLGASHQTGWTALVTRMYASLQATRERQA